MCTVAYLRQCAEKNKGSASTWLRRFAALLHVFFFLFFSCFLFRRFFLFLSHSLVVRTRMSHHRQAPQRGPERRKKNKKLLSASRGSNRWDVKQKQRKKGTLSAKLWNTETAFMAEGKRKHRLAQLFCCVQTRFFFCFFLLRQ